MGGEGDCGRLVALGRLRLLHVQNGGRLNDSWPFVMRPKRKQFGYDARTFAIQRVCVHVRRRPVRPIKRWWRAHIIIDGLSRGFYCVNCAWRARVRVRVRMTRPTDGATRIGIDGEMISMSRGIGFELRAHSPVCPDRPNSTRFIICMHIYICATAIPVPV